MATHVHRVHSRPLLLLRHHHHLLHLHHILLLLLLLLLVLVAAVRSSSAFNVYWNVPSETCRRRGIQLPLAKYGFTFNSRQQFHGEAVRIFYRPGRFPHLSANGTEVNGVIPQRGNLPRHLSELTETIKQKMPHLNMTGPAVIDFEKWKPSFNHSPRHYREQSWLFARDSFPGYLPWSETLQRAERQFEFGAKVFFSLSLVSAERLRPYAAWGYYQYPLCNNYHSPMQPCPISAQEELRRNGWMYHLSRALYPSIYLYAHHSGTERRMRVLHHLNKAQAVARHKSIYPYTWFQYHSRPDTFLNKTDLLLMFGEPLVRDLPGVILWGATHNVNTEKRCLRLKQYLDHWLGPLVQHLVTMTAEEKQHWKLAMRSDQGRSQLMKTIKWSEESVDNTLDQWLPATL